MAVISNLVARLRADTSTFDRKMGKSRRHVKSFHRDVTMMGRQMRTLTRRVMIAAGITGLGYMIKQTMSSIDATAKLSDRLGVSTKSLIGLQHAASITGTSAEILNKSLEMFTRRLGEMTLGSGEAKRGLDMLGLTSEQLIHKSPAEAFGIAADKIRQLGTQAEKSAAAYFLFGRSGSQLVNMLEVGSEGLKEFQKDAEKLGLTFSRFDASQVEAANDALTRAGAVMTGVVRQATIQLAPYIEAAANSFVNFATKGEGVGRNVVNIFESASLAAVRFGGLLSSLPAYWKGFEAAAHQSLAVVYDIADAATNLDVLFKKLGRPGWEKTYKELADEQRQIAAGLLEEGGEGLAGTYGQENAVKRFFEGLRKRAKKLQVTLGAAAGQRAGVSPLVGEQIKSTVDIAAAERAMYGQMKRMTTENYQFRIRTLESLKQKYVDAGLERVQIEQWYVEQAKKLDIERLRSSQNMFDGIRAAAEQMKLEMKSWGDIAYEAAMTMQKGFGNAFADVLMNIKTVDDAFKALARSVVRSMLNSIGQNIAGSIMGGLFGGAVGGGGLSGAFPTTSHGVPYMPDLQHGGEVLKTGLAVVHRNETFSGVQGGGALTVNVNYTGQERPEVTEAEYDLRQQVLNITMEAAQTNGPYRRSIKQATR